eukprot:TRINITY_DN2576_c2_g1_i1.p1 TRINITY_DN2576_c2_g1~~TRINITY_DN2576_c2_g1_i1.p1  ORF type:complete len:377 (+),score=46.79 TRINITY_DN2576_c2_g1_i1:99-1229(+)
MESTEGRSAGKAVTGGRLRIGQILGGNDNGKSSIPSRFETILFTGARERNAFGRRTHRFDTAEDDLPGPGSYGKNRTLVKTTPSMSKRGTGAFASGSRIAANQPRALFLTPGPGSYPEQPLTAAEKLPSAAFAKPVPRRAITAMTSASQIYPGPGEYQIDKKSSAPMLPSAIFDSRTKRHPDPRGDGPGPGEYLTIVTEDKKDGVSSAVFKSSIKRESKMKDPSLGELAKTLPQPPHAGPQGFVGKVRDAVPSSPSPVASMQQALQDAPQNDISDKVNLGRSKAPPSSMFATTLLDRFGKPVIRYVPESVEPPGPGQYQVAPPNRRLLISSSWAMSSTSRFNPPVKDPYKPPGPAFYTPVDRQVRSFHLNNKGKWV